MGGSGARPTRARRLATWRDAPRRSPGARRGDGSLLLCRFRAHGRAAISARGRRRDDEFTGELRFIYLPVVRHSRLAVLQRAIYEQVSRPAKGASEVWQPSNWIPHLTLASLAPEHGRLGARLEWLWGQDLDWSIPISRLAIGEDTGEGQRFTFETPFEA